MSKLRACLAVALAAAGFIAVPATMPVHAAPATSLGQITDPKLLAQLTDAASAVVPGGTARIEQLAERTVSVEILTVHPELVASTVRRWGGTVTGDVPGAVVQASLSPDAAVAIAASPGVSDVRSPRRVGYVPVDTTSLRRRFTEAASIGTGPTFGDEVVSTNAAKWQAAGFDGTGAKVGIVDYFDFDPTIWQPAEHGPIPDGGHMFCRDSFGQGMCVAPNSIANDTQAGEHGVAVTEIIRDMAPGAEIYVASVATVSDLRAAIAWFAGKGVTIMSRSLGAAYDGPGDGTGPLGAAVDYAASKGITWFNSAGNDGEDSYLARPVASTDAEGYVNFASGRSAVADTWLRVDSTNAANFYCYFLDGVRWGNDWRLPASQRTDYRVEVWEPRPGFSPGAWTSSLNPTTAQVRPVNLNDPTLTGNQGGTGAGQNIIDAAQRNGAVPLEGADLTICPSNVANTANGTAVTYLRIKRNSATPVGAAPDHMEVALAGDAILQFGSSDRHGSAAKPVVDSKNPSLVAVGAVDPLAPLTAAANSIAFYSSQGPTNDGRIKPDMSAPSGMASTIYAQGFSGTSSAAPTAAGAAALVAGAHLAVRGAPLAALVKHFATDLGPKGPDNAYGTGLLHLPSPPKAPPVAQPGRYVPLATPTRIVDTRPGGAGTKRGPFANGSIVDVKLLGGPVPATGVSAVAVNLTSTDATSSAFVQASPYLTGTIGSSITLSVPAAKAVQANFTILPVGNYGMTSIYLPAGGNVIVDVLGYFTSNQPVTTRGRFVPLTTPERWMDTRTSTLLPASFHAAKRQVKAGETVSLPVLSTTSIKGVLPRQVAALVVNLTAANAASAGYVRAAAGGRNLAALHHSNLNFVAGGSAANTAIVPTDATGHISLYSSAKADLVVDVVGYITSTGAPASSVGTFVPLVPTRAYNTIAARAPFGARETRVLPVSGGRTGVPVGIGSISANVTVTGASASGFLTLYPGSHRPSTSNVNYRAGRAATNGALLRVNAGAASNTVTGFMNQAGHVIIDVNGYFVAAPK